MQKLRVYGSCMLLLVNIARASMVLPLEIIYFSSLKDKNGINRNIVIEKIIQGENHVTLQAQLANRTQEPSQNALGTFDYTFDFTNRSASIGWLRVDNLEWRNLGIAKLLLRAGLRDIELNPKIHVIKAHVINPVTRMMFALEGFDIKEQHFDDYNRWQSANMEKKIVRDFDMSLISQKTKIGIRKTGRFLEKSKKRIASMLLTIKIFGG